MHLSWFRISNVKCFDEEQEFVFPEREDGRHAGWHVILGANASGKTTVLRAMAMCLLGPSLKLLEPVGWVRKRPGEKPRVGFFGAELKKGREDVADTNQKGPFFPKLLVTPDDIVKIDGEEYDHVQYVNGSSEAEKRKLSKSVYASRKAGWFSCGYGPFRRLSGGDEAVSNMLTHPRQHRFISLFHESVALAKCEPWLINLHHQSVDKDSAEQKSAARTLEIVKTIVDSLLPSGVKIHGIAATPMGVQFATAQGPIIQLSDLSDGYRSFLALAMDILRHLADTHGENLGSFVEDINGLEAEKRVTAEGIVLIDEVDAHLHPTWQRKIGFMLQKVFPNIQFIVSTHSPFIAQAASEGGLFVLRAAPQGHAVRVVQPVKSVRGWRAEAILTSALFGLEETIDTETEDLLREYHRLSTKRSFGQLSSEEQTLLDQLEARVGREITAPGETIEEFDRRRQMEAYVDETLRKQAPARNEKSE